VAAVSKAHCAHPHIPKYIATHLLGRRYYQVASKHAESGRCDTGSLCDLLIAATRMECDEGVLYLDIDPITAMKKAKQEHDELEDDERAVGKKLKFDWSQQSKKASSELETQYGSLEEAWLTGWRWYPEPDPKNAAHGHRFYPPTSLLAKAKKWDDASEGKKRLLSKKSGLDGGAFYMTSPSTCLYLLSSCMIGPAGGQRLGGTPASAAGPSGEALSADLEALVEQQVLSPAQARAMMPPATAPRARSVEIID